MPLSGYGKRNPRRINATISLPPMKIYTRTGDAGTTSLVGGTRVSKTHPRLEAYGTVDEVNSHLGLLAAYDIPEGDRKTLLWLQNRLFDLGCQLATEEDSKWKPRAITADDVAHLEALIDEVDASLPRHNRFILPGGTAAAAQAHVARTVARRAERDMLRLDQALGGEKIAPEALKFVNRLSDYLFVTARHLNIVAGYEEIFWEQE